MKRTEIFTLKPEIFTLKPEKTVRSGQPLPFEEIEKEYEVVVLCEYSLPELTEITLYFRSYAGKKTKASEALHVKLSSIGFVANV